MIMMHDVSGWSPWAERDLGQIGIQITCQTTGIMVAKLHISTCYLSSQAFRIADQQCPKLGDVDDDWPERPTSYRDLCY